MVPADFAVPHRRQPAHRIAIGRRHAGSRAWSSSTVLTEDGELTLDYQRQPDRARRPATGANGVSRHHEERVTGIELPAVAGRT
jgi:hypothetical protein